LIVPYATVTDMVLKFGEAEMRRLSVADGLIPDTVQPARITDAIDAASVLIDSYLRKRYPLPLGNQPSELNRAACILARYDLANAGDRTASEEMRLARKEVVEWLRDVADGRVELAGVAPIGAGAPAAGARTSDRDAAFFSRPGGGL